MSSKGTAHDSTRQILNSLPELSSESSSDESTENSPATQKATCPSMPSIQSYISAAASNGSNGDASGHAYPIQQPSIENNRIHKHVYANINESQRTSSQEISTAIELIYFQNAFGKN